MSHFSKIKTKMNNQAVAIAALQEMGYEVEVHETAQKLNMSYRDRGKAHIIVRREQLGYCDADFGLLSNKDGSLEMIGDMMYQSVKELANKLPAAYAKQVLIQKAQELGDEFTVTDRFENGVFAGYSIVVEKSSQLMAGQSLTSNQLYTSY